jgi:hypothetical protein
MLFSYLFTTCLPLPLLFLRLTSVVWHILLVVPVSSVEFSADSCSRCRLSCLMVTRGLGENGRNFECIVGATQPIGIFLPPPSHKFTQLGRFNILPPSRNFHRIVCLRYLQLFLSWFMESISSHPFFLPLFFAHHLSFPSMLGKLVCRHQMCGVPPIHYVLAPRHILRQYPISFLPVLPLDKTNTSSFYIFPACDCFHLEFLGCIRFHLISCARENEFSSTM